MGNDTIRIFEAFAGYGSQHMALSRLASEHENFHFEVVGISEIDPHAIRAYMAVHGETANYGDITRIDWNVVPDFDLFTYSFPCQDISSAGKQAGFARDSGSRSSLLWECQKAIGEKKPKFLLMENVKALLQQKFRNDLNAWMRWLESNGYSNYIQVLNARNYGVAQNRERVFLVSKLDAEPYFFPKSIPLQRRLGDFLEDSVSAEYYLSDGQVQRIMAHCDRKVAEGCGFRINFQDHGGISGAIKTTEGTRETDTYIKEPVIMGYSRDGKGKVVSRHLKGESNTIVTSNRSRTGTTAQYVVEPSFRIRKLTPRECFRLMGVTDADIDRIQQAAISKTQQYKLAGNSIVVDVLYHIFRKLFIEKERERDTLW